MRRASRPVYGLVAPLWEQTARLADRLSGRNPDAVYLGSTVSTKLKVMGVDLAVMGDKEPVGEDDEVVSYSEPSRGIYKKLIVRNDRLAGAIVLGDGAIVPSLLQTFASGMPLTENRAELLFLSIRARRAQGPQSAAAATPDSARICDCNDVSKAQIIEAVLQRRAQRAGGLRRHARVDRLRLVPARSRGDRRARVPGHRDGDSAGRLRSRCHGRVPVRRAGL